jgi:hypothetical protein
MKHHVRNAILGSAATLALLAGASAPAFADGDSAGSSAHPKTLAAIQASAKAKTGERITKLNRVMAKITAAKDISDGDRSTILATLHGDVSGMNTVEAKIAADTTVATASADYATIFTEYRVYAVAIPQSRLAAAADRLTSTTIPRLTDVQSKLAAALAKHPRKSTPALRADLTDMTSKITAASGLVDGLAADALAVTPAAFNSNHNVLSPERTSLKSALANVTKAAADGKAVRAALK